MQIPISFITSDILPINHSITNDTYTLHPQFHRTVTFTLFPSKLDGINKNESSKGLLSLFNNYDLFRNIQKKGSRKLVGKSMNRRI